MMWIAPIRHLAICIDSMSKHARGERHAKEENMCVYPQQENKKKKGEEPYLTGSKPLQASSRTSLHQNPKVQPLIYAPLVCRLENLVLLFALMKLLLPLPSTSPPPLPLPLPTPSLTVKVLPFLVATLPSSLLFSTTS